jgi:8-oxo-dGTP diphosphatase
VKEFEHPDHIAKYGPGPYLTGDAVVIHRGFIAIIRRKKDGIWALPGGFMEKGETFTQSALREFKEEAGVDLEAIPDLVPMAFPPVAFDSIDRDPRGRVITGAVLLVKPPHHSPLNLIPGDDADLADWFPVHDLPTLYADHNEIVETLINLF